MFKLVGKSASEVGALASQVSQEVLEAEQRPPWEEARAEMLLGAY